MEISVKSPIPLLFEVSLISTAVSGVERKLFTSHSYEIQIKSDSGEKCSATFKIHLTNESGHEIKGAFILGSRLGASCKNDDLMVCLMGRLGEVKENFYLSKQVQRFGRKIRFKVSLLDEQNWRIVGLSEEYAVYSKKISKPTSLVRKKRKISHLSKTSSSTYVKKKTALRLSASWVKNFEELLQSDNPNLEDELFDSLKTPDDLLEKYKWF